MAEKTQAMRVLDAHGMHYAVRTYDPEAGFHSAGDAAMLLGVEPESVYKTLVVLRDATPRTKPLMVMIPALAQVDLKLLARETGEKKLRMALQREAEQLTGMQVGGISALALRKPGFVVLLDAAAEALEKMHVSAGIRGIDIEVRVADLCAVTGATIIHATADGAHPVP